MDGWWTACWLTPFNKPLLGKEPLSHFFALILRLCHACIPPLPCHHFSTESLLYAVIFSSLQLFLDFHFFQILVFLTMRDQKALICYDDICTDVQRFDGQACSCPCGYSLSQAPHCASSLGCAWSGGEGWRGWTLGVQRCAKYGSGQGTSWDIMGHHGTSWDITTYSDNVILDYSW
jgi:hypothetical protein